MNISYDVQILNRTAEGDRMWEQYARLFKKEWGIERNDAEVAGGLGRQLFDAEVNAHGAKAYEVSIIQPMRNAYYMRFAINKRWPKIKAMKLVEPILDYGCGCGFTLAWLARQGYTELYGYEVAGIQRKFIAKYGNELGFKPWDNKPKTFGTVICLNVLEHLEDPLTFLDYLYTLSPNLIANCCMAEDTGQHIASIADKEECNRRLSAKGHNLEMTL